MTADQDVLPHSAVVPSLADLTTLRVGGPVSAYVEAATEHELLDAVREADASGTPLLVVGGGSNLLVADEGFDGIVVRDMRSGLQVGSEDTCGGAVVTAPAGHSWDELVREAVESEWFGIEALSGIPGTVGAAPVQNIGAYGQEVSSALASIRVWDRAQSRVRTLVNSELGFGYRTSVLKRSMQASGRRAGDGDPRAPWYPTPRYVVLDVTLQMRLGSLSAPIAYGQLAARLGVEQGDRAPSKEVREAVLAVRSGKGMVLDDPTAPDHDRWSAGSFFTNPIVSASLAQRLPDAAPRFTVRSAAEDGDDAVDPMRVKVSAAWLIQHAGFAPGFGLTGDNSPARLSTKHTLALTNRGTARADDLVALARAVRDGVRERFDVTLVPEPVLVGVAL